MIIVYLISGKIEKKTSAAINIFSCKTLKKKQKKTFEDEFPGSILVYEKPLKELPN